MDLNNTHQFCMPRLTLFGWGCTTRIGAELKKLQVTKGLLVTDQFMVENGTAASIIKTIQEQNISAVIYDGVKPDPDTDQVQAGVEQYLVEKCNALISLGGGSPHDCAKGIKLTLNRMNLPGTVHIPLVAITTTAGTGSEVTRVTVITDKTHNIKTVWADDLIVPDIAVDDPALMMGMPPRLTAATGMDALTHAIEAYVSRERNPFSECTAIKAIQLIEKYLVRAFNDGRDRQAREGMAYAQYLAGIAFSNSGLGLAHAVAHPLGGLYGIPHGTACAVMLPYVVTFNQKEAAPLYAEIAWFMKNAASYLPEKQAARIFRRHLLELNQQLAMPVNLRQLDVNPADFPGLAEKALQDMTFSSNPRPATAAQIIKIYQNAYEGGLIG